MSDTGDAEFLKRLAEARQFLDPSKVDVVVYHSPCNDGHGSAACFYHYTSRPIDFYGVHPKDDILADEEALKLIANKRVVFVDVCFAPSVMTTLANKAKQVLVLDHHITNNVAMADSDTGSNMMAVFVMGRAGVHMTWEYLYPGCPINPCLDAIGLKDVWKHEEDPRVLHFNVAFERPAEFDAWRCYVTPTTIHLGKTMPLFVQTADRGKIIYEYQQSVLRTMMEKVQTTTWRGYTMAHVNVPFPWISDIGAMMCEADPEHTIAVIWNKTVTGPYSVSLRSHNPRGPVCSAIAKEFGGGGHAHGAGGIHLDVPPFLVFTD